MSVDSMGHLGILREENIALRQMMGYNVDSLEVPPYEIPQIGQFIPGTSIKDVLVVAIDIDNPRCCLPLQDRSYHIGLSILDTRCLASRIDDVSKTILSYQFINDNSKSCRTAKKRFLFGETETMLLSNLAPRLAELVKGRDYVLVGHGINEDIKLLNQLHPDISGNAAYYFDTVKVAQFPLKLYYRYSLEKLLDELGIKYANLHAAGNDAHFALKALLMLAVRDGLPEQHRETSGHQEELFLALETIAHAPVQLPVWTDEPPPRAVPAQKKKKMGVKAKGRLKRERRAIRRAFQNLPLADTTMASSDEEGPDHSLQGNVKSAALRSGERDESTANSATEYLNDENGKFSKSRGVGVLGNNAKDTVTSPGAAGVMYLTNAAGNKLRPLQVCTAYAMDGLEIGDATVAAHQDKGRCNIDCEGTDIYTKPSDTTQILEHGISGSATKTPGFNWAPPLFVVTGVTAFV